MAEVSRDSVRTKRRRLPWALVAVVAVGLVASACSSGSPTPSVAGLPQHSTTQPSTGSQSAGQQSAAGDQAMVAFTRCMRGHGTSMSDPFHRPGHQGLTINLPPQDAATAAAYHACNHFLAHIIAAKEAGAAALAAPNLRALTNYAQCMRSHDIDMLDPNAQGSLNLGNVPGITDNFGRYSPQFRAADAACRHLLPAGVHDDGSGP